MITPGFLSDCLAILLLLPPTRTVFRGMVLRRIREGGGLFRVVTSVPTGRPGPDDDLWDVESWEDPPERPGLGR
jgi:UPF0716 family protein affecting phage T7 exclusion